MRLQRRVRTFAGIEQDVEVRTQRMPIALTARGATTYDLIIIEFRYSQHPYKDTWTIGIST